MLNQDIFGDSDFKADSTAREFQIFTLNMLEIRMIFWHFIDIKAKSNKPTPDIVMHIGDPQFS